MVDNQIQKMKSELDQVKEQLTLRDESDENLILENFSLKNFKENIGEYDRT